MSETYTKYNLDYTGASVDYLLGQVADLDTSLASALNTKISKVSGQEGQFAVFTSSGELAAGGTVGSTQEFKWKNGNTLVPMVKNFTYDTAGATLIDAGVQSHRIEANQILTGQIIANHATSTDLYGTAPVADSIVFQKVALSSDATSAVPRYETIATLSSDGLTVGSGSAATKTITNKIAQTSVLFHTDFNNVGYSPLVWGNPYMYLFRAGNVVTCYFDWVGTAQVSNRNSRQKEYPSGADKSNSHPIPVGYRPICRVWAQYVGLNNWTVCPECQGRWYFTPTGEVGCATNNGGGYERQIVTSWITQEDFPNT